MNTSIKYLFGFLSASILFVSCSQPEKQSLETMLSHKDQQGKILAAITSDHELSTKMIDKMIANDHTANMLADGLVKAAAKDSVLANRISSKISQNPDLMLMTVHHFMPVINAHDHLGDDFCEHALQQPAIAATMCKKMEEGESACH